MHAERHQIDYVLFFTVIILCAVGVLTVYSASTVIALQNNPPLPASYFAQRQLVSAALGVAALIGLSVVPHQFWYKAAVPLLGASLCLLLVVLVPGIGWSEYGGRRWIGHGSLHLQPSELAMIALIIYLAFFFTKKIQLIHDFRRGLLPALIVIGLTFLLILAEPDMGTGMTLVGASLVVVFASGVRLKPLLLLAGAMVPLFAAVAMAASYRSARIAAWLHPLQHANGNAYQLVQGMTAISAGGWFGRGFDMSIEKMGYLPFPQTDFIFPVFVEEWGYVGAMALLVTFSVLVWRGFRTARRAPDRFGALLAIGLTSMLTVKSLINLGAVTGLLPVTGIPLPFISYGGTSLVVNMAAMGIVLSISRYTLEVEPEEQRLADVIAVAEVEHLRERRSPSSPRPGRSQPAKVHRLEPRLRDRGSSARSSWRTRNEGVGHTPVTPAPTWRERLNSDKLPPPDKPNRNGRRDFSRRER